MGPPPQRGVPTFEVRNPADDSLLALVPDMGPQDAKAAIVAAEAAFMAWARRSAGERATILRRWHDLVLARQDDLALLLTLEQGKPLGERSEEHTSELQSLMRISYAVFC